MSKDYNNKVLLEMLDISIGGLVENEICCHCKIFHNQDHRCKNFEQCQDLIFQGLQKKAEKAVGEQLYLDPDADDDKMPEDEMFDPVALNEMYEGQI